MNRTPKAVRSLVSFRFGRKTFHVLPFRALVHGAVSLLVVVGLALGVDRVLGRLEDAGWTSGERWLRHNKVVEANRRQMSTTNECEPRWWQGQTLRTDASRKIL